MWAPVSLQNFVWPPRLFRSTRFLSALQRQTGLRWSSSGCMTARCVSHQAVGTTSGCFCAIRRSNRGRTT
jgi:hypothetical protein